ncbi:hypothetical protein GCM10023216_12260 [Isoptericola chiayiensis]|uniref:Peptidase S9 n=1 Tax=Isoptericola chiayiensis TaxID=579446 RepID=A0ABP8Y9R8_9MICO|nr:hypothetical protein [Isoptericola chiayiensis]NOW00863.1 hypothetical protein [Isoptericola chiayiensis]
MRHETGGPDVRAAVVGGVATAAWYAVPDVVRPRWARALAKTAVLAGGLTAALAVTRDGRAARAAVDELRDAVDGAVTDAADPLAQAGLEGADPGTPDDEAVDNPAPTTLTEPPGPGSGWAGAAVVTGGLTLVAGAAVAGEILVHRLAERLGARGWPAPHTTVGIVLGAAAAGLSLVEPRPAQPDGAPPAR